VPGVLARLVSERGAPKYLRSDNGPEFVARALLQWITDQGIDTALIDPGKPWQNGVGESFNGKFRDECLSLEWFRSRAEARIVISSPRKSRRPSMQRAGTLRYRRPPRPGPLHHTSSNRGAFSQVKIGPKKQGRSVDPEKRQMPLNKLELDTIGPQERA